VIRVTVQLIPKGIESAARTLGTMEIVNDASGDEALKSMKKHPTSNIQHPKPEFAAAHDH